MLCKCIQSCFLCACAVHFQQQKSNHLVRKELQAHLSAHQQMLAGYTDYIKRHTHVLLQLVLNNPQVSLCRCL